MRTVAFVFFSALLAVLTTSCGEEAPRRPNVLLISLDTCRQDRLGCYGYARETSPRIDQLAEEGLLFEDCLAQSTATAPSHTSLLTGQYVRRHGLLANGQTSYPRTTLAGTLKDAGWATGAFTGHGSFQKIFGHGVGFEVFESWPGTEHKDRPFSSRTRLLSDVLPYALQWLDGEREEAPDKPFFLLVHGYDPHCPYVPPEIYRRDLVRPYEGDLQLANQCGMAGFQETVAQDGWTETPDGRYLSDVYDAEIRMADDAVGRVLDALRERDLYDNTIVIFTSDHGELLGEHGWVGHTRIFEPELRVPLIIRFPRDQQGDGPRGQRYPSPVEHVDLFPTLLGYLGLPRPDGLQGIDHTPYILRGLVPPSVDRMRLAQINKLTTVRFDTRYKAVFGEDARDEFNEGALFDLVLDPEETTNLLETEDGRRRFGEIRARFDNWATRSEPEDRIFSGTARPLTPAQQEELEDMLRALGYLGED